TLETANGQIFLGAATGSNGEAAVAHHDGGHAMPRRARAQRIPTNLGVHVRMPVDEAGCDEMALGVDLAGAALGDATDRGDRVGEHRGPWSLPQPDGDGGSPDGASGERALHPVEARWAAEQRHVEPPLEDDAAHGSGGV